MLQRIIDSILISLGINLKTKSGEIFSYFLYDSIKIIALLFFLIWLVGILRSFLSEKRIKEILSKQKFGSGNILASIFGAITPFCSCSSIPIFLSFIKAGVPLGVTFSFLITSPIVNEYLVVIMFALFGWKIAAIYVLFGVLLGTFSGIVLEKMKLEKYLVKDMKIKNKVDKKFENFKSRIVFGLEEASSITKKLWLWILIGVGIGAVIHNFVPTDMVHNMINKTGFFSVPIAVLIGVPMYGSCAAIVPIALVLFEKGVPLGTALSFMMAVSALSLPEVIILRRAMKLRLILIFFGVVTTGIILIGYLFNAIQPILAS